MSINIQGKPLKEWVEEQKKKDGVMIVHRGTQRTQFGTSCICRIPEDWKKQ